jgi:uncharacterized membrane protein (DUF485 family)
VAYYKKERLLMTFPRFSSADALAVVLFVLGGLVGWLIAAIYYRKATKDLEKATAEVPTA